MQTKGFIRVLTYALILICLFYLSFSFVSNHYQNKAEQKALAAAGIKTPDTSNEKYKTALNEYLDSLANQKVYLGYYTFQQVREKELGYGLDLKGGMNVTLQISVPDILRALANNNPDKKFNQAIDNVTKSQTAQDDFVGSFCKEYKKLAPEGNLAQIFRNVERIKEKPNANANEVENILKDEVNNMVDNSYKVLRNRIDRFGVVQPNIQKLQSTGRILLELPGVKEPERVRKLLQGAANLEFYETYTLSDVVGALRQLSDQAKANGTTAAPADTTVAENAAAADSTTKAAPAPAAKEGELTLAQLTNFEMLASAQPSSPVLGYVGATDTAAVNAIINSPLAKTILPADLKMAWTVKPEKMQGGHEAFQLVALKTLNGQPVLNGDVVTRATSEFDNMQGQVVSMTMNDEGARQWSRITGGNIGKAIAIVLDDQVYSFPNVNSQIDGGRSQISGRFTVEEAGDLANVLESGKMVARVNVASESVIGPSLGKESIEKGFWSFIIAFCLVLLYMVFFYSRAGIAADIALLVNILFFFGVIASFGTVLTLPGIAGIVLTLGMAVDSNVIIFERIKEEIAAGKGIRLAIADGFKAAYSAILDGQITTFLTGFILFEFGTGPVQGFATTLMIGICTSLFTSIFITRLILEAWVDKDREVKFSTNLTRNFLKNTHFDFIKFGKTAFIIGGIMIVISFASLATRGLNLGIDFKGGRNYVVRFDKEVSVAQVREALANIPEFKDDAPEVKTYGPSRQVKITTKYEINSNDPEIDAKIQGMLYTGLKDFYAKDMTYDQFTSDSEKSDMMLGIMSSQKVGPTIANDVTRKAVWAVIISLVVIFIYIAIRFKRWQYGASSIVALAHDTIIVIGMYSLFYNILPFSMEVDQSFIAAVLTIIGYSINNTVVIFDRIRENVNLYPKRSWYERMNDGVNSTLLRSINTSGSTLVVLLAIFIFGGETIRGFVFALLVGIFAGTFSSLFIASPIAYMFFRGKKADEKLLETADKKRK